MCIYKYLLEIQKVSELQGPLLLTTVITLNNKVFLIILF